MKMRGKLQILCCNGGTPSLQKSQGQIPCIIMNFSQGIFRFSIKFHKKMAVVFFNEKEAGKEHQRSGGNAVKNLIL